MDLPRIEKDGFGRASAESVSLGYRYIEGKDTIDDTGDKVRLWEGLAVSYSAAASGFRCTEGRSVDTKERCPRVVSQTHQLSSIHIHQFSPVQIIHTTLPYHPHTCLCCFRNYIGALAGDADWPSPSGSTIWRSDSLQPCSASEILRRNGAPNGTYGLW